MMVPVSIVVFSCLALAAAIDVKQCAGGPFVDTLKNDVVLTPCPKMPCELFRETKIDVTIKFKTDAVIKEQIEDLTTYASATSVVLGVSIPVSSVDMTPACGKLETESGEKASCPLSADTTYVYKNFFTLSSYYPDLPVILQYSLRSNGKDVTCFTVRADIK